MAQDDVPKQYSKTTETAFEVIESIREIGRASVTELADHTDLAASTVHNHLGALQRLGFVVKEGQQYRLSLQFLNTGMAVRNDLSIVSVAQPAIDDLARETGEAAWAATLEDDWIYFICNARGENAIQAYGDLGTRRRPHAIAAGKSILAYSPVEDVLEIISRTGLQRYTDQTITSKADLFEEFELIRERGYSLNWEERLNGGRAVACAILYDGRPVGAVGVSGPAHRFQGERFEEELPKAVRAAKNEIELELSSPL